MVWGYRQSERDASPGGQTCPRPRGAPFRMKRGPFGWTTRPREYARPWRRKRARPRRHVRIDRPVLSRRSPPPSPTRRSFPRSSSPGGRCQGRSARHAPCDGVSMDVRESTVTEWGRSAIDACHRACSILLCARGHVNSHPVLSAHPSRWSPLSGTDHRSPSFITHDEQSLAAFPPATGPYLSSHPQPGVTPPPPAPLRTSRRHPRPRSRPRPRAQSRAGRS